MNNQKPDPNLKKPADFSNSYLEAVHAQVQLWDEAIDCLSEIAHHLKTISLCSRRRAESDGLLTPVDISEIDKEEDDGPA